MYIFSSPLLIPKHSQPPPKKKKRTKKNKKIFEKHHQHQKNNNSNCLTQIQIFLEDKSNLVMTKIDQFFAKNRKKQKKQKKQKNKKTPKKISITLLIHSLIH
jgi:hypothetical protein